jgi:hypothetical protein
MEEAQRIQEALQKGESVLSDSQVELIKHHTAILGEDGEAAMREIQKKARESVCLPTDIARVTDSYCKDLSRRVGLRELSNDLEKDKERERLVQLEAMEAEVSKYKIARAQGNLANLVRVKGALSAQLKKYLEDIEADEEGGVSSTSQGNGRRLP